MVFYQSSYENPSACKTKGEQLLESVWSKIKGKSQNLPDTALSIRRDKSGHADPASKTDRINFPRL